ncbi:MAG: ABC transporter permease [Anaerolineales bacterium]|jgi:ABC-2 type transport system permease protein|nr:ABC transporter permease [Anaerolineales bacterium]
MKKLFFIGLKDLKIIFRDRAALIFMLLAPFLLTLGLGFVTGHFSGGSASGLSDIPVVLVNLDQAQLGDALVDLFQSEDLSTLLEPSEADSPEAAYRFVDEDQAAAAIIIPAGFSASVIPGEGALAAQNYSPDPLKIEVYANPSSPTSAGVIKSIVDEFISRVEEGRIQGTLRVLSISGVENMPPEQVQALARALFENGEFDDETASSAAIVLKKENQGPAAVEFDPLAYMAPGMALMFLMYTVSYGGRSILAERAQGTLPRLMISPTSATQILGGKVFGIFLTGVAQMGILILASALFFGVRWGDPLGMLVLILASVFGATGWGLLLTALSRSKAQVSNLGTAIMLIFGILGGTFIDLSQMPPFVRLISRITPNAWGLDGFTTLALGGGLPQLAGPITALLGMGALLFGISAVIFRRSDAMKS